MTYERRAKVATEARLLLDPTTDRVEALIALDEERLGWLSPSAAIEGVERTQAQGTIEFFHLNLDVPLVRERIAVLDAVLAAIDAGTPDKARRLAIRFRPYSLVARAMLLELGQPLPSVEQELRWQVDELVTRLDGVMEALEYAPDDETNRSAQRELLWSLAVVARFPLGLPSEFVLGLLRSHGVADAVLPYFERL